MAIPFFSIDLSTKDYFRLIINILNPFNKKKLLNKLKEKISTRFPNRYISILPSGRLGFYLTMKFLFKPNDLVIFSSMSFPLYIKIAKQLKIRVKLIDVSEHDLNINVNLLDNIDDECKGLVVTHLFGNPCEIKKIQDICKKKNIKLIEDCAQSFDSKYDGIDTGNFGDVGIISTSLLKIPTTLSGGIIITKDKKFNDQVCEWVEKNLNNDYIKKLKLFVKISLFIINSYPIFYSLLSDKIFSFLKNFNPRIYRKILYSGMGMKNIVFDPKERPNLTKFQLAIGISQIDRCKFMTEKRQKNSQYLQSKFKNLKNIKVINDHFKEGWNHQYFVIHIKDKFEKRVNKIFDSGIHAMDENVWDCRKYNFEIENINSNFEITEKYNKSLLRIQNNSFLSKKDIDKITNTVIKVSNEN